MFQLADILQFSPVCVDLFLSLWCVAVAIRPTIPLTCVFQGYHIKDQLHHILYIQQQFWKSKDIGSNGVNIKNKGNVVDVSAGSSSMSNILDYALLYSTAFLVKSEMLPIWLGDTCLL
ncbi:hypothetical protein V6N13_031288 [Hibiscus sabdariffa]|uniref:Uncharacterized protein n=1 Tax=Hibiscus sabdariffa TaxID=183260 RepID=A0ABR2CL91_9ROSI